MRAGDIKWPSPYEDDVEINPQGGLGVDLGDASLAKWVQRCIAVEPGEMIHRPEFGVGVQGAVDQPITTAGPVLASRVKSAVATDRRVLGVGVGVKATPTGLDIDVRVKTSNTTEISVGVRT
jgi:hypothetical protein